MSDEKETLSQPQVDAESLVKTVELDDLYKPAPVPKVKVGLSHNYYFGGPQKAKQVTKRQHNLQVGLGVTGGGSGYRGRGNTPHSFGWIPKHTMTVWSRESDHGLGRAQKKTRQHWLDAHPLKKSKKK